MEKVALSPVVLCHGEAMTGGWRPKALQGER